MKSGEIISDDELSKMMKRITGSEDKEISWDDFVKMMTEYVNYDEDLKASFDMFDINGDSFITEDELWDVMVKCGEKLTREVIRLMINDVDTTGDGKITFQEFRKYCKHD